MFINIQRKMPVVAFHTSGSLVYLWQVLLKVLAMRRVFSLVAHDYNTEFSNCPDCFAICVGR